MREAAALPQQYLDRICNDLHGHQLDLFLEHSYAFATAGVAATSESEAKRVARQLEQHAYVPFAQRPTEKTFEQKVASLTGKKLARKREKDQHRQQCLAVMATTTDGAAAIAAARDAGTAVRLRGRITTTQRQAVMLQQATAQQEK
jgi:hypothetical protein